jgi:hypothetical protein
MTELKREYYTNDNNEIIGLESEWEEINGRKHGYYKNRKIKEEYVKFLVSNAGSIVS